MRVDDEPEGPAAARVAGVSPLDDVAVAFALVTLRRDDDRDGVLSFGGLVAAVLAGTVAAELLAAVVALTFLA